MIRNLVLFTILPFLGGCISSQNMSDSEHITIDAEQSVRTHISYATEYQGDEEIVIRGTVRRLSNRVRPLRGHLDLQIYAANGTKVEQNQVDLVPYGSHGKRSRARFTTRVTLKSPNETLVRLRYHEGSHEREQNEKRSLLPNEIKIELSHSAISMLS